jgi:hypothetical protein
MVIRSSRLGGDGGALPKKRENNFIEILRDGYSGMKVGTQSRRIARSAPAPNLWTQVFWREAVFSTAARMCRIGRDLLLAAWVLAIAAFVLLIFAGFLQ